MIEKCHGCKGKGWVVVLKKAQKCLVCEGSGEKPQEKFFYPPVTIKKNTLDLTRFIDKEVYCLGKIKE